MTRTNASLAVQNATLAPGTHEIYGALGYPQLKFNAWPERHPAKITWLGTDVSIAQCDYEHKSF